MKYNKNLFNKQATAELLGLFTPRLKPLLYMLKQRCLKFYSNVSKNPTLGI